MQKLVIITIALLLCIANLFVAMIGWSYPISYDTGLLVIIFIASGIPFLFITSNTIARICKWLNEYDGGDFEPAVIIKYCACLVVPWFAQGLGALIMFLPNLTFQMNIVTSMAGMAASACLMLIYLVAAADSGVSSNPILAFCCGEQPSPTREIDQDFFATEPPTFERYNKKTLQPILFSSTVPPAYPSAYNV